MSFASPTEVAFGSFRLSVRRRTLRDRDGPVPLPSRAFDVLLALIESRAAVVSKDDLMRRVWGDLVVEENNLHVQIAAVRRALGAESRCILTVPGRGYRFVGDLGPASADPRPDFRPGEPRVWRPPGGYDALPVEMTALIGRKAELAAACALFDRARLVTLVGPGGVGKTKLALAVARALQGRFPAGCRLVELGPVAEAASALAAIAAILEVEPIPGQPLAESLPGALRHGGVMLILDGCEHLAEPLADTVTLLLRRCPQLQVLCTSQTPLGVEGEHVCRIAPFDLPTPAEVATASAALQCDAVRLFVERASAVDGRFAMTDATAASVVELCRSLDGLPLAIELAAARAPLLGLEPLRSCIAERLTLLGGDGCEPADRHRTLGAAMAWSYRLLPPAERRILRQLSVFSGGFTLAAAQAVGVGVGVSAWEIARGVGALVQRSLVSTGPDLTRPRHRLLRALRELVCEQPGFAEEHAALAREHARYFLHLAETANASAPSGSASEPLALLTPEIDNLRAALDWSLGPDGDPPLGARLAGATAAFGLQSGFPVEGLAWLARATTCGSLAVANSNGGLGGDRLPQPSEAC